MPIDWGNIVKVSGEITKKEFQNQVSSLTSLTDSDVAFLIKQSGIDQQDFAKLMVIVNDATISNENKAKAIQKIDNGVLFLVNAAKRLIK